MSIYRPFDPNLDSPFGPQGRLRSFDTSDYADKLRKSFFSEIISEVEKYEKVADAVLKTQELIKNKSEEFKKILTSIFPDPQDEIFLTFVLATETSRFANELKPSIYQILKQKEVPKPKSTDKWKFWKKI